MKTALKKGWESDKWNLKVLQDSKFGLKKVDEGKETSWMGRIVIDESTNTLTMTAKQISTPETQKTKKLKSAQRPVFVLTFNESFTQLTGEIENQKVTFVVKEVKTGENDDLGF